MFFRPKGHLSIKTDIHSHLIPGVDDGVKTVTESITVIKAFQELGYSKLITTPHISEAYYPNSPNKLKERFDELIMEMERMNVSVDIRLGAEYMVDGLLLDTLKSGEEILSWDGYVLIETSFQSLPWILDEVLFELQSRKLTPVLAHPERYPYFFDDLRQLEELRARGVKLQVTIGSVQGRYGKMAQTVSKKLLNHGMADFLGSDVHRMDHMTSLQNGLRARALRKRRESEFLNFGLA